MSAITFVVEVLRPTQHKIGHLGDVPQANLLAWYGKTKLIQQRHAFTHSLSKTNVLQHKRNKKLNQGLVPSYDIRPGNGVGLFLFWHFINL